MEIISHLWVFAMDKIHVNEDYITLGATQDMVLRLAQLTRNVAAGCPNNQLWIMRYVPELLVNTFVQPISTGIETAS